MCRSSHPAAGAPPDADRNRLRWRCRRGMLELDLILERLLDETWPRLDADQRRAFEALLALEDHDLWQRLRVAAEGAGIEALLRDGEK